MVLFVRSRKACMLPATKAFSNMPLSSSPSGCTLARTSAITASRSAALAALRLRGDSSSLCMATLQRNLPETQRWKRAQGEETISYARDLLLFVDVLGFTPAETLVAATRLGGEIMGMADELGQIKAGYLADLLLVDGNPLEDIKLLQNQDALLVIMKDGRLHKQPAA